MLKKSADYRRNYWLFLGHCRLHKQKQRNQLMLNGKKQGGLVNCSYETDNLELNCIIKTWILVPFNIIQILRNCLLWLFTDSQHFAFSSSLSLQYSNLLSDFQLNDISKDFHVRFRSLCIQKSDLKLYPLTVHRVKMSSEFSLKRLKSFTMYLQNKKERDKVVITWGN